MSRLKFSPNLFLEVNELNRLVKFLDDDGNEIKVFIRKNPIIKSIRQLMSDDNITEKEVYYKYSDRIFEAKDAQTSIRTRIIEFRKNFSISDFELYIYKLIRALDLIHK